MYRLSVIENEEIMKQVQEFLDKGFIQPSASPCDSPIIFLCQIKMVLGECVLILEH